MTGLASHGMTDEDDGRLVILNVHPLDAFHCLCEVSDRFVAQEFDNETKDITRPDLDGDYVGEETHLVQTRDGADFISLVFGAHVRAER